MHKLKRYSTAPISEATPSQEFDIKLGNQAFTLFDHLSVQDALAWFNTSALVGDELTVTKIENE